MLPILNLNATIKTMNNQEIAKMLKEIAAYLEMEGVEFKPRAYEKAAYAIESLEENLSDIYRQKGIKGLKQISGIGTSIAKKIEEALTKKKILYLEKFRQKYPIDLYELISIEGIGPKLAKKLYQEFKIKNLKDLEKLLKSGKIRQHKGFGIKSEQRILKGIEFYRQSKGRFILGYITNFVEGIKQRLQKLPQVQKVEICGSYRRYEETIGDIDILVVSKKPSELINYFVNIPEVTYIYAKGKTKANVRFSNGLDADLRVVPIKSWGSALQYFTGNKDHNISLRIIAEKKGYKLNEYGLFTLKTNHYIAGQNEEDIYLKLGLQYIPPELRTNWGELEVAQRHQLPSLINYTSIKGDLQTQTNWSDGQESIEQMVEKALKIGLEYIAITDHSKSLGVAHGLNEKRLYQQFKEIDQINQNLKKKKIKFRILKSSEVNILKDGSLDWPDTILAQMDIVIAAIHDNFNLPEEEQTKRMILAMQNKYVDIIAHPTGRIIQKRPPYKIDIEKVLKTASQTNTIMEINAFPDRLDLDTQNTRLAKSLGVKVVVNSDAHHSNHFNFINLGVAVARRAGLEQKDVLNTLPLEKFLNNLPKRNKTL